MHGTLSSVWPSFRVMATAIEEANYDATAAIGIVVDAESQKGPMCGREANGCQGGNKMPDWPAPSEQLVRAQDCTLFCM